MPKLNGKIIKAVRVKNTDLGRVVGESLKKLRELAGFTQSENIGLALLIIEGFGHAGEPESDETLVGVIAEHRISFLLVSGSSRDHGCCRAGWDRRRG